MAKSAGGAGRAGRSGGASYPQNLTKMSSRQQKKFLSSLTSLPLKELRRRQDINAGQIAGVRFNVARTSLANLRFMERMLTAAVDKVAFG